MANRGAADVGDDSGTHTGNYYEHTGREYGTYAGRVCGAQASGTHSGNEFEGSEFGGSTGTDYGHTGRESGPQAGLGHAANEASATPRPGARIDEQAVAEPLAICPFVRLRSGVQRTS